MSWFERVNKDLGYLICKSDSLWRENNLLYETYVNPKLFEKHKIKLLFFQVSKFDLDSKTEEIWSPITSKEDYGIEQDIPW